MTYYQQWLSEQSSDFLRGFDAYWSGLTDDISETEQWHAGYEEARQESSRQDYLSERQRFV